MTPSTQCPTDSSELPEATGALIDYILTTFHDAHRRELPPLIELARKVEAVHAGHPQVPAGLADALEATRIDLEDHMLKEENVLFPFMRQGMSPLSAPIGRMRHEHADHEESLLRLQALAGGFEPPEDACDSWRTLYVGVRHLTGELRTHMRVENELLFPRFE
ncbi:hemerythrin domain-containing protein [Alkalilimnicola ehrlichii MLHE-1]|uniref:Hemerythrin HHE cation binding domain protein n=1 Tax=Alkalilimnicola ehrlichii (strain ATCC BAA-1101 / DSM 17681 / MLHE-1) TaxID=187272 RepID=Q0AB33_ALKEH|nr:hemerythrin domain-containing protein [Alkalilimnicola ehrlichii]ABI55954.1 Hemerythrin HHE cation binding domain protein [Alkalilimnicola ehrlichii MLHE-1]